MVHTFNVEHQKGEALQRPATQAGKRKFKRVSRRSCGRTISDLPVCRVQGINEAQCSLGPGFAEVVINRSFDIPTSQLAQEDGLAHLSLAWRTRARKPSK